MNAFLHWLVTEYWQPIQAVAVFLFHHPAWWPIFWYAFYIGFLAYASVVTHWSGRQLWFKILIAPAGILFLGSDVFLNWTWVSLIFLQFPSTWTTSQRLAKNMLSGIGYRKGLSQWFVADFLFPFAGNDF